jgi:hypothetical protein
MSKPDYENLANRPIAAAARDVILNAWLTIPR